MGAAGVGVAGDGMVLLDGMGMLVRDAGAGVGVSVLLGRAVDVAVGVGGADVGVLLGGAEVSVGRGVSTIQFWGMGTGGRGPGVTVGIGVSDDDEATVYTVDASSLSMQEYGSLGVGIVRYREATVT